MAIGEVVYMGHDECPYCKKTLSASAGVFENAKPSVGDVTICACCGEPVVFGKDFGLEKMTNTYYLALPGETKMQLLEASMAVRKMIRDREKK